MYGTNQQMGNQLTVNIFCLENMHCWPLSRSNEFKCAFYACCAKCFCIQWFICHIFFVRLQIIWHCNTIKVVKISKYALCVYIYRRFIYILTQFSIEVFNACANSALPHANLATWQRVNLCLTLAGVAQTISCNKGKVAQKIYLKYI